jgi:hypothetical protein
MNRLLPSIFCVAILSTTINAQNIKRCSTTEYEHFLEETDPNFTYNRQQADLAVEEWLKNNPGEKSGVVVTIPVVVHVVYNTSQQNISDKQVYSGIDVLNRDFSRQNLDTANTPSVFKSIAADTEIRFCVAHRDPNGAWTNGITRTQTNTTSFNTNDAVKSNGSGGKTGWDRNKYLNIWVCNLGSGLLGYATPPGASASSDGVVCGYRYFGDIADTDGTFVLSAPFNKGRTVTHEVGHWLNLRHIWGDSNCGNDLVNDTPTQQSSNFGCPNFPKITCSNGPNGDMFTNYMDYSDDGCMNVFSVGQGARMQACVNTTRVSLKTSDGCEGAINSLKEEMKTITNFSIFPNPASEQVQVQVELGIENNICLEIFDITGKRVFQKSYSKLQQLSDNISVSNLESGIYLVKVNSGTYTKIKKLIINQ